MPNAFVRSVLSCALWLCLSLSPAQAGQVVILSSTLPDYTPGTIVDGTDVVELPAGGMLMFNDSSGATRTLAGPYSGAIEASTSGETDSDGVLASLSRLVTSREEEQAKLGAIRAMPGNIAREVYVISVARSATQCVDTVQRGVLWRPETLSGDSRVKITDLGSKASSEVFWPEAEESLAWPTALPLQDGTRYRLKLDLAPRPVEITLRMVPAELDSPALIAAWMADAGCRRQALLLVSLLGA